MDPKVALTVLALAMAGSAPGQNRALDFQIARINRDLITTPDYSYNGAEQPRSPRERWLRVETQFSSAPDFTDELPCAKLTKLATLRRPDNDLEIISV